MTRKRSSGGKPKAVRPGYACNHCAKAKKRCSGTIGAKACEQCIAKGLEATCAPVQTRRAFSGPRRDKASGLAGSKSAGVAPAPESASIFARSHGAMHHYIDPSRNPAAVAAQWTPGFSVGGPPTQVTRPHPQTLYTPDALGMPWGGGGALPLPSRAHAAFHPAHSASTPHHLHVNQGMPHKATPGYTMPPHGQPGDPLAPGMAVSWGTARSLSGEVAFSHMQASEVQAGRAESQWLAPVATRSSGNTPVHSDAPFPQRSWPGSGWLTAPHGGMGMPPASPTAAAPASWAPARTVSSLSGKRPRQEASKDLPPGHFTGSPTPPPADGAGTASHVQDPTAQWQPAAKAPRAEGSKCRSSAVPQQVQGVAAHAGARVEGGATRPALVQPSHLPVTTVHPAHRNGAAASQAWASAPVML